MSADCAAYNCSYRSDSGLGLFSFPIEQTRRQKWIRNVGGESWIPEDSIFLCEKHFEEPAFEQRSVDGCRKLKPDAVPTLCEVPICFPGINASRRELYNILRGNENIDGRKYEVLQNNIVTKNTSSDLREENEFLFTDIKKLKVTMGLAEASDMEPADKDLRCRTCLTTKLNKKYINVEELCIDDATIENALSIIVPHLNVDIKKDDFICDTCLVTLRDAMSFVITCLHSDDILYRELENAKTTDDNTRKGILGGTTNIHEDPVNDCDFDIDTIIKNADNEDLEQEILFWNRISSYYKPKRKFKNMKELNDINIGEQEKVVCIGPLKYHFSLELVKLLQEKVQIVQFGDLYDNNLRILLLGSNSFKKCPVCDQVFLLESEVNYHFEQVHKDVSKTYLVKIFQKVPTPNSLQCNTCNQVFKTLRDKEIHAAFCVMLKCPCCQELFLEQKFTAHIKKELSNSWPFECIKCNQTFLYHRTFRAHRCDVILFDANNEIATRTERKKSAYMKCRICGELVPLHLKLNHIDLHRSLYICSICGHKSGTRDALRMHEESHRKSLCPHCGKLLSVASYRFHMNVLHNKDNEGKTFNCPKCNKVYRTKHHLKMHMIKSKRLYTICELCGIKCRTISLKGHYITKHSGNKFKCTICTRQFSRKDYLLNHLKMHSRYGAILNRNKTKNKPKWRTYVRNPNEPLSCKFCLKMFTDLDLLKSHMETHGKTSRFKCKHCDMTYTNRANCTRHEKLHENPYYKFRCHTCWKICLSKEELDEHTTSKHSQKYSCPYCNKSFSREFVYTSHLFAKHPEEEGIIIETIEDSIKSESFGTYEIETL